MPTPRRPRSEPPPAPPRRLLVHRWAGRYPGKRQGAYDISHHITGNPTFAARNSDGEHSRTHLIGAGDTEFDELVVGSWLHVEQMDHATWWMSIGGVVVHVTADCDRHPLHVWVCGPGDYDDPVDGCTYELTWTTNSHTTKKP